jgi:hypothetical protein
MLDPARLVFIGDTAVSTNMVRLRGRAPRANRVIGAVPRGASETLTFVGALRHALCRTIRSFVPQLSAQEYANYFRHAGYANAASIPLQPIETIYSGPSRSSYKLEQVDGRRAHKPCRTPRHPNPRLVARHTRRVVYPRGQSA